VPGSGAGPDSTGRCDVCARRPVGRPAATPERSGPRRGEGTTRARPSAPRRRPSRGDGCPAVRREDPADVPFLPSLGQVYLVATALFQPPDKKPRRPFVVVDAPLTLRGRIAVVARTTDTDVDGIAHGADPALNLDKDGVFAWLKSTEAQLWTPRNALLYGQLPPLVLQQVMRRWYE
jgi:hypothetical protein